MIAWVHPPKCGTSFGTTLIHFANHDLPDTFEINPGGGGNYDGKGQNLFWREGHKIGAHRKLSDHRSVYKSYEGQWAPRHPPIPTLPSQPSHPATLPSHPWTVSS